MSVNNDMKKNLSDCSEEADRDARTRKELQIIRALLHMQVACFFDPTDGYYDTLTHDEQIQIQGTTFILPNGKRFRIELVPEEYCAPDV